MERCPACRARYKGETTCYRCGSDLILALQAEKEAEQWTQRAVRRFSKGAFDDAERALQQALVLHQTPLALTLRHFFNQHGMLRSAVAAKPGFVLADQLDREQPGFHLAQAGSPATVLWQRLGWLLLHLVSRADMRYHERLPNEPAGLIRGLADVRFCRRKARSVLLRGWVMVGDLWNDAVVRLAELTLKRPEMLAVSKDPLKPVKEAIRAAAVEVYQSLGPGLPAPVYEECLCRELTGRGISFRRQVPIAVNYKDAHLDSGYRMNLFVAEKVMVLIEGADASAGGGHHSLRNYLCADGLPAGLLINFNVTG